MNDHILDTIAQGIRDAAGSAPAPGRDNRHLLSVAVTLDDGEPTASGQLRVTDMTHHDLGRLIGKAQQQLGDLFAHLQAVTLSASGGGPNAERALRRGYAAGLVHRGRRRVELQIDPPEVPEPPDAPEAPEAFHPEGDR